MDWVLQLADWFGSALCHQWNSHSYIINGIPLCLCARCTGTYLGVLLTLGFLAARTRGIVRAPRAPYLAAFIVFFLLWAGDGTNSYLTSLRGAPFLYPPQNLLRVTTGILMGLGLGTLMFLILNSVLYPFTPGAEIPPLFARARDFFVLLVLAGIVVAVIQSQFDWLLIPLNALLLVAIFAVNTVIWLAFSSSMSAKPREPAVLRRNILLSFLLALLVLNALALARVWSGISMEPPI